MRHLNRYGFRDTEAHRRGAVRRQLQRDYEKRMRRGFRCAHEVPFSELRRDPADLFAQAVIAAAGTL